MVLHAFVTSRIDYCNGLLYGLSDCEITKLQGVQNAAASLLTSSRKYDHITLVSQKLHWLPFRYRIHFKISRKTVDSTYPFNRFKEEGFSRKTSASFRLLKIYKHITPSQRDMSIQNAASQWNNMYRTPSVHSMES